jgi:hypothetical protein
MARLSVPAGFRSGISLATGIAGGDRCSRGGAERRATGHGRSPEEAGQLQGSPPALRAGYEDEKFVGAAASARSGSKGCNSGRRVAIKFYNRRGGLDWSLLVREVEKLRHLFTDRHVVSSSPLADADPPYYVMEYMEHGFSRIISAMARWRSSRPCRCGVVAVGLIPPTAAVSCTAPEARDVLLDEDHQPRWRTLDRPA